MNNKLNLTNLTLNNFATFTNQSIDFTNEFNTIVGETGSGKSLILDALQLCFGSRADKSLVRKGSDFASVEVSFTSNGREIKAFFDEIGYPTDEDINIKRIIYANGKSKSFLNFSSCSLTTLASVARQFIDLVGQFENQKLLSDSHQLSLLDKFAKNDELLDSYKSSYSQFKQTENKLKTLQIQKENSLQRKDFLKFQIDEINELGPTVEDENNLKTKKDYIINLEENKKRNNKANFILSEDENNIITQLSMLEREFSDSASITEKLIEAKSLLEDVSYEISKSDNDFDETSLDSILERLDLYQRIKRKYRCETKELVHLLENFEEEYHSISNIDSLIDKTLSELDILSNECQKTARRLHDSRALKSAILSKKLSAIINKLNMKGAVIDFRVQEKQELTETGFSTLNIYAQTNPGEGFYPLSQIASGGELSRILLAIRQVLSATNSISVFLFDEIDTGIGGETAVKIGKALKEVSLNSQVIAITHLPQIANFSDHVILIEKETSKIDGRTRTKSVAKSFLKNEIQPVIEQMQAL